LDTVAVLALVLITVNSSIALFSLVRAGQGVWLDIHCNQQLRSKDAAQGCMLVLTINIARSKRKT